MAGDYFFDGDPLKLRGEGTKICLLLDFDGTLVPIRNNPGACALSTEVKGELAALAASGGCSVAVLSGRSLADIKKRVAGCVYYGGNHGLTISGPGVSFVHPGAAGAKPLIDKVRRALEKEISPVEGAWIEDKGYTFTLHYREVGKGMSALVGKAFSHILAGMPERERVAVLKGKRVLELMPNVSWDKGKAALYILDTLPDRRLPLYIGDDITDESAFRALKERGITVRVGPSVRTAAGYYLKGQREILRFLQSINRALLA